MGQNVGTMRGKMTKQNCPSVVWKCWCNKGDLFRILCLLNNNF